MLILAVDFNIAFAEEKNNTLTICIYVEQTYNYEFQILMSNEKDINTLKSSIFMIDMESAAETETIKKEQSCSKCHKTFNDPELIQYYACPHCKNKIVEKEKKTGCQYWFGYLNQKSKCESMPQSCVECEKVVECMLNRYYSSTRAVTEIKKWY